MERQILKRSGGQESAKGSGLGGHCGVQGFHSSSTVWRRPLHFVTGQGRLGGAEFGGAKQAGGTGQRGPSDKGSSGRAEVSGRMDGGEANDPPPPARRFTLGETSGEEAVVCCNHAAGPTVAGWKQKHTQKRMCSQPLHLSCSIVKDHTPNGTQQ